MDGALILPEVSTADAPLPARYEAAKHALVACDALDECKTWVDKMEAMRSYARQSEDEQLEKMAMRIKARAIRRCGQLLAAWQTARQGGRPKKNGHTDGAVSSQREAAAAAGMSKRQEERARTVANIPKEEFEQQVESDNPPTINALVDAPRPRKPIERPTGFHEATKLLGLLRRSREFMEATAPVDLMTGFLSENERQQALADAFYVATWLTKFRHTSRGTKQ